MTLIFYVYMYIHQLYILVLVTIIAVVRHRYTLHELLVFPCSCCSGILLFFQRSVFCYIMYEY